MDKIFIINFDHDVAVKNVVSYSFKSSKVLDVLCILLARFESIFVFIWLLFFSALALIFIDLGNVLELSLLLALFVLCISCHFDNPSIKIDSKFA